MGMSIAQNQLNGCEWEQHDFDETISKLMLKEKASSARQGGGGTFPGSHEGSMGVQAGLLRRSEPCPAMDSSVGFG